MPRPHDRYCPHTSSPPFQRNQVLSSNSRNRLARAMPEYQEPEPTPDYQVAGPLNPPINGVYYETGLNEGKPYYKRTTDEPYFIWYTIYDAWHRWYITAILADRTTIRWHRRSVGYEPPPGFFTFHGGAAGNATVTAI